MSRFGLAPEAPSGSFEYLLTHRPVGFTAAGSGTGSAADHGSTTLRWVDDQIGGMPPGVDSASLLISVAPVTGGKTALRVDAQVTWRPAKPPGTTVPPQDHVAVVSIVESNPNNPGLPAPRSVLVTTRATVSRLVRAVDNLPAPLPGAISCPAELGTSYVIAFATSASAPPDISYRVGSCNFVAVSRNGKRLATLSSDQALYDAYSQVLNGGRP